MSELKQYIDNVLDQQYSYEKELSCTAVNKLKLYKHNQTGNKIILIKSNYRNDDVFRKLKSIDTNSYLPTIYEVSSEDDYLYVLEEFVEGDNLADILQKENMLDKSTALKYMLDLCDALQILHSQSIVHRDIKPENVIIRNSKACLIDLSIAKIINSRNDNDTMNLGTIGYAAPEQFGFSQSQPTTDIYALGVLANEIVLGVHPTVEIPKGRLGKIIKKCTSTQISKRYQNIDELKKALKLA